MQLLRLIRCEARRLLRNPAYFVLLIWGIWIVKDVCNPNMYGTYGTSDLGGVGKQIGFFANILDKTDPAGSDGTIHDLRVVFRSGRMHCYFLCDGLSKQVF